MASRFRSTIMWCAIALLGGSATAERIPGLLDDAAPRPISGRFNMPDWLTYADLCFHSAEDELLSHHPRIHASAPNIQPDDLFASAPSPFDDGQSLFDLLSTIESRTFFVQMAPSPVRLALQAAAETRIQAPITDTDTDDDSNSTPVENLIITNISSR